MSTITIAAIRSRIATAIAAIGGSGAWKESNRVFDFGQDAARVQHLSFAVDIPQTPIHPEARRQKITEGALCNTIVLVEWAHMLRADGQVADFATALAEEATLTKTLMAISGADIHVVFEAIDRQVSETGEWFLGTIGLRIIHTLALQ